MLTRTFVEFKYYPKVSSGSVPVFELKVTNSQDWFCYSPEYLEMIKFLLSKLLENVNAEYNLRSNNPNKDIDSSIAFNLSDFDTDGLVDYVLDKSDRRAMSLKLLKESILKNNNEDIVKYAKNICGISD